ncbi:MAG: hypothetical protein H0Z24_08085 [Thermosipho sp. (in: Bacteria)]|nr:hypothetical protein [Thermosipho sp. (in: thermotogales)]
MKKFKSLWIVFVAVLFVVFGCVGIQPIDLGPSEVSDTGNLDPDTPAYFIDIVTDEDFSDLLDELFGAGIVVTSVDGVSSLPEKSFESAINGLSANIGIKDFDPVLNATITNNYDRLIHIINIISSKENLINKMKQFRVGVNNLLQYEGRYDYVVEITGNAKTKVETVLNHLKDLDPEYSVDTLYGDFRDVMLLNLLIEPFIFVYDNQAELITIIENASKTIEEGDDSFFRSEFLTETSSFTAMYPTVDFSSPTYLEGLKAFLYTIAGLAPDVNYLDLYDIFADDAFVYTWIDNMIHLSDLLVKTIVEINAYEVLKTDANGFRTDGKVTLWSYGMDPNYDYIAITLGWYDEPFIYDMPEGLTATLNGQSIDETTTVIDVLNILNTALPNNTLNLALSYATPIDLEHSINIDLDLTFDFEKLSAPSIDMKNCNLRANSELFEILNIASITEFSTAVYRLSNGLGDQNDVNTVLDYLAFITSNLEFVSFNYDEQSTTTTIVFEYNLENGAIVATLTITLEGFTIPQLFNPLSIPEDVISNLGFLSNSFLNKIEIFN